MLTPLLWGHWRVDSYQVPGWAPVGPWADYHIMLIMALTYYLHNSWSIFKATKGMSFSQVPFQHCTGVGAWQQLP